MRKKSGVFEKCGQFSFLIIYQIFPVKQAHAKKNNTKEKLLFKIFYIQIVEVGFTLLFQKFSPVKIDFSKKRKRQTNSLRHRTKREKVQNKNQTTKSKQKYFGKTSSATKKTIVAETLFLENCLKMEKKKK